MAQVLGKAKDGVLMEDDGGFVIFVPSPSSGVGNILGIEVDDDEEEKEQRNKKENKSK